MYVLALDIYSPVFYVANNLSESVFWDNKILNFTEPPSRLKFELNLDGSGTNSISNSSFCLGSKIETNTPITVPDFREKSALEILDEGSSLKMLRSGMAVWMKSWLRAVPPFYFSLISKNSSTSAESFLLSFVISKTRTVPLVPLGSQTAGSEVHD